jgi:hypothetical protein
MPEKGWAILTVREETADRVKELAHSEGLTIDEFINELMNPAGKAGWLKCNICGVKVKAKNLHQHILKAHPKTRSKLTSQRLKSDGN